MTGLEELFAVIAVLVVIAAVAAGAILGKRHRWMSYAAVAVVMGAMSFPVKTAKDWLWVAMVMFWAAASVQSLVQSRREATTADSPAAHR